MHSTPPQLCPVDGCVAPLRRPPAMEERHGLTSSLTWHRTRPVRPRAHVHHSYKFPPGRGFVQSRSKGLHGQVRLHLSATATDAVAVTVAWTRWWIIRRRERGIAAGRAHAPRSRPTRRSSQPALWLWCGVGRIHLSFCHQSSSERQRHSCNATYSKKSHIHGGYLA